MRKEKPITLCEYIGRIKSLRDDYSDDIPEKIIHSTDKNKKYKVRRGWFGSVYLIIDLGLIKGYLSEEFKVMYKDFQKYCKNNLKAKTTKKNIDTANNLLTTIINKLENSNPSKHQ